MRPFPFVSIAIVWILAASSMATAQEKGSVESPLGFPTTITDLYIPGTQVEPIPRKDSAASLVIRILEIKPAADGFRYDLEVYGLDPGTHALGDYLQHTDTSAVENLEQTLTITTQHPLDALPKPEALTAVPPEKLGGYRLLAIILGVLWFLVLLVILFYRKKGPVIAAPAPPPPTLHEKLHALVTHAAEGNLSENQQAQLERLIVGHWKAELPELEALSPAKAIQQLRSHPEASPLVLKLEEWLHAPKASITQTDINKLLAPFR